MTSPLSDQQSPNRYADAVAAQLRRAPAQLAPQVAAEIGDLIGPIGVHVQDADTTGSVA